MMTVEEFFSARVPRSSAEVRRLFIHDIKEVEGVGQQEQQEDQRDDEEGDEMNGEVKRSEATLTVRMKHEDDYRMNEDSNLIHNVRASNKEDSQKTTTPTDNKKKRETTRTKDLQCMKTHALASTTLTLACSPSVSGHFTNLLGFSLCTSCRQFNLSLYQLNQFLTCTRISCRDLQLRKRVF